MSLHCVPNYYATVSVIKIEFGVFKLMDEIVPQGSLVPLKSITELVFQVSPIKKKKY